MNEVPALKRSSLGFVIPKLLVSLWTAIGFSSISRWLNLSQEFTSLLKNRLRSPAFQCSCSSPLGAVPVDACFWFSPEFIGPLPELNLDGGGNCLGVLGTAANKIVGGEVGKRVLCVESAGYNIRSL